MYVAIVADDLTGAADCAVEFSAPGRSLQVVLDSSTASQADVLAVDVNSRELPSSDAGQRVTAATQLLKPQAPHTWFKKLDSTLRGNVAAELAAFGTATECSLLVVAPSYPAQGRGLVGGTLLSDNHLATNDAAPRHLPTMLEPTSLPTYHIPLGLVRRGASAIRTRLQSLSRGTIVVADATTDEDLDRVVAAAEGLAPGVAFAGSAGLAAALARAHGTQPLTSPRLAAANRVLLVVGSRHPASRRQLARAGAYLSAAVEWSLTAESVVKDSEVGAAVERAFLCAGALLLATSAITAEDSARVATGVAAMAAALIAEHAVRRVFCTGGEIARSLCDQLGIQRFSVEGRVLEGMPALQALDGLPGLMLVTKAGGFGGDDSLVQAYRYLAGGA